MKGCGKLSFRLDRSARAPGRNRVRHHHARIGRWSFNRDRAHHRTAGSFARGASEGLKALRVIDELYRSHLYHVARAYHWKEYVPEYTKQPIDEATIAAVVGRYRRGGNSLVAISGSAGRLFMADDGADPGELFRITDSTYARRTDRDPVRFQLKDANVASALLTVDENDGTLLVTAPRMKDDESIPFELVQEGKASEATAAYKALLVADPNDPTVSEQAINDLGYQLLNEGKTVQARDLFHVNVQLCPKSANTYDSYAEACLKNGELELALTNYTTAYAMDPENVHAKKMVEEIKAKLRTKS